MTLRTLMAALVVAGLAGCGPTSTPTGPSPQTYAPAPPPTLTQMPVTFRVRSGVEGLPALAGAAVQIDGRSVVTGPDGTATIDAVIVPSLYRIQAVGFLAYSSMASDSNVDVTLWPVLPGMTMQWVGATSYYGPDYDNDLWRPASDVVLDLQGVMAERPYRDVWAAAVADVASAIDSAHADVPTIRLGAGAGAVPVRLVEAPRCKPVTWGMQPSTLIPPPELTWSNAQVAGDPVEVLGTVAWLVGFNLQLGRRYVPTPHTDTLSPLERTAIRMRMLRHPGTTFDLVTEAALGHTLNEIDIATFCR